MRSRKDQSFNLLLILVLMLVSCSSEKGNAVKDPTPGGGGKNGEKVVNYFARSDGDWKRTIIVLKNDTSGRRSMVIQGGVKEREDVLNKSNCKGGFCKIPIYHTTQLEGKVDEQMIIDDRFLDQKDSENDSENYSETYLFDVKVDSFYAKKAIQIDETMDNGYNYFIFDVYMDCNATAGGFFEFTTSYTNGSFYEETDISSTDPYEADAHFGQCGKVNTFTIHESGVVSGDNTDLCEGITCHGEENICVADPTAESNNISCECAGGTVDENNPFKCIKSKNVYCNVPEEGISVKAHWKEDKWVIPNNLENCIKAELKMNNTNEVNRKISIYASVRDLDVDEWKLELFLHSKNEQKIKIKDLKVGNTTITDDQSVAEIDPAKLPNGVYEIVLTEKTDKDIYYIMSKTFVLKSKFKIGKFVKSYTDMRISTPGIPLAITRVYNSSNDEVGDFGYGWDLAIGSGIKILRTERLGVEWSLTENGKGLKTDISHRVIIKNASGKIDKFQFRPKLDKDWDSSKQFEAEFIALGKTRGVLELQNNNSIKLKYTNGIIHQAGMPFSEPFNPTEFVYRNTNKTSYHISVASGLTKIEDINNNVVTVEKDRISHSNGKFIEIKRDETGKIEEIKAYRDKEIDEIVREELGPEVAISYRYKGDLLVEHTNAEGKTWKFDNISLKPTTLEPTINEDGAAEEVDTSEDDETTEQPKDEAKRYRLRAVRAPYTDSYGQTAQKKQFELTYYKNGWLKTYGQGEGSKVTYLYNSRRRMEMTIDEDGNETETYFDHDGDVIKEIYTPKNSESMTLRAIEYLDINSYDDEKRKENLFKYFSLQPVEEYSAREITAIPEVDPEIDFVEIQDLDIFETADEDVKIEEEEKIDYKADILENLQRIERRTNLERNVTVYGYDKNDRKILELKPLQYAPTLWIYKSIDDEGELIRLKHVVDAKGYAKTYHYDTKGNRTKAVNESRPFDNFSQSVYEKGKRIKTIHKSGVETKYFYDELGHLKKKVLPNLHEEEYTFDSFGNKIKSYNTAQIYGGETVNLETRYIYNNMGRLTKTIYPNYKTCENFCNPNSSNCILGEGNRLYTETIYNDFGGVLKERDIHGNEIVYEYDDYFRVVSKQYTVDGSKEIYTYYKDGKVKAFRNRSGRVTTYFYDSEDREIRRCRFTGTESEVCTSKGYDKFDRVSYTTDEKGNTLTYTYDELGREKQIRDSSGSLTEKLYDQNGNLVGVKTKKTKTVYIFDAKNRKTHTYLCKFIKRNHLGEAFCSATEQNEEEDDEEDEEEDKEKLYNSLSGVKNDETAVNLNAAILVEKITYSYDGRVELKENGNGNITSFTYDKVGSLTKVLVKNEETELSKVTYTYDKLGRKLTQTVHVNQNENEETKTDAYGNTIPNSGNDKQHVSELMTAWQYDERGNVVKKIIPSGDSNESIYSCPGFLESRKDFDQNRTSEYEYDSHGNVKIAKYTHVMENDAQSKPSKTNKTAVYYTYNYPEGTKKLVRIKSYNKAGSAETSIFENQFRYEYDRYTGYFIKKTSEVGQYKPNSKGKNVKSTNSTAIAYEYYENGNIEKVRTNGGVIKYDYDNISRLEAVTKLGDNPTNYQYNLEENGQVFDTATYPNGVKKRTFYDSFGRIEKIEHYVEKSDEVDAVTVLETYEYKYDQNSNVVEEKSNKKIKIHFYDGLNRLVHTCVNPNPENINSSDGSVDPDTDLSDEDVVDTDNEDSESELPDSDSAVEETVDGIDFSDDESMNCDAVYSFEYTKSGNIKIKASKTGDELKLVEYFYNSLNQLIKEEIHKIVDIENLDSDLDEPSETVTYKYDANGNMIEKGGVKYEYNYLGKISKTEKIVEKEATNGESSSSSKQTLKFIYDDQGNRIFKSKSEDEKTYFVVDVTRNYPQVIEEIKYGKTEVLENSKSTIFYTYGNDLVYQKIKEYVPGSFSLIDSEKNVYLHYDKLGSTRFITGKKGDQMLANFDYSPYGKLVEETYHNYSDGSDNKKILNPYVNNLFTGEQFDKDLDLYYLRARYYDPSSGRFNSFDPWSGNSGRSMSLNKYAYTEGNPVNFVDYSGHWITMDRTNTLTKVLQDLEAGYNIQNKIRQRHHIIGKLLLKKFWNIVKISHRGKLADLIYQLSGNNDYKERVENENDRSSSDWTYVDEDDPDILFSTYIWMGANIITEYKNEKVLEEIELREREGRSVILERTDDAKDGLAIDQTALNFIPDLYSDGGDQQKESLNIVFDKMKRVVDSIVVNNEDVNEIIERLIAADVLFKQQADNIYVELNNIMFTYKQ